MVVQHTHRGLKYTLYFIGFTISCRLARVAITNLCSWGAFTQYYY